MYISQSALSVRVFSVLPWICLLLGTSCQTSPPHVPPIISKSLFSLCNGNLLPTPGYRMSSFTQNRRMECCYPIPFPCRFLIISLKSNFYLRYLEDFYGMFVLFLFPIERTSPNIQSVQNVLTCTGRTPHWAPEMSWYSTSSLISIVTLDCNSLPCFMLWAPPMLKEYSASSFEPQQCLLTLEARLIP